MTLNDAIQTVVAARRQYHTVHIQVQHLREAWASHYAPLLQEEAVQKQAVRHAEEALRRLAIVMYQATGSKSLAPGVQVREMTRLTYDSQDALAWATEHRIALMLDSKTFDALAHVTALPFVTYWMEPQATLSPCLSAERPATIPIQEATSPLPPCASPESTPNRADD